jgi:hypothetical protein
MQGAWPIREYAGHHQPLHAVNKRSRKQPRDNVLVELSSDPSVSNWVNLELTLCAVGLLKV